MADSKTMQRLEFDLHVLGEVDQTFAIKNGQRPRGGNVDSERTAWGSGAFRGEYNKETNKFEVRGTTQYCQNEMVPGIGNTVLAFLHDNPRASVSAMDPSLYFKYEIMAYTPEKAVERRNAGQTFDVYHEPSSRGTFKQSQWVMGGYRTKAIPAVSPMFLRLTVDLFRKQNWRKTARGRSRLAQARQTAAKHYQSGLEIPDFEVAWGLLRSNNEAFLRPRWLQYAYLNSENMFQTLKKATIVGDPGLMTLKRQMPQFVPNELT